MAEKRKIKSAALQSGKMDIAFFTLVITLLAIGLVMMFSASYAYSYAYFDGDSYKFIRKQGLAAVVGLAAMFVCSKIDYHLIKKIAWPIYGLSVVLLIYVMFTPKIAGVHRWIPLPLVGQFQPSELGKLAIIVVFSALISAHYKDMKETKFIFTLILLLGIVCGLVVIETHISATVLIFGIGIVLIFIGGLSKKWSLIFGTAMIGGITAGYFLLKYILNYANDRIVAWKDPFAYSSDIGYQTVQSLLAIGSGGIFGRGLGQSRQKHLWVPEPHNDFIFSIVCEELGLIGALIIIALFCLLVWRGFTIAMRAPDKFGSLMAVGLTFQVGLQTALNIMVVTNIIPNTGISLPFFSYGGTALVLLLAEMGVVLSISRSSNLGKV